MKVMFYKGTRPGFKGIYNRAIRFVTHSQYSHCELLFDDGMSASSSYEDKGVRFKVIQYDRKNWDCLELPRSFDPERAVKWFDEHLDEKYDLLGALHFLFGPVPNDKKKWFCSEAIAAALGLSEPERYDPGSLHAFLESLTNTMKRSETMLS